MKKIGKVIPIILCLIMCASMLASCSGNNAVTENTPTATVPTGTAPSGTAPSGNTTSPTQNPGFAVSPDVPPPPEDAKYAEHISIIVLDNMSITNPLLPGGATSTNNNLYVMYANNLVRQYGSSIDLDMELAESWETKDFISFVFKLRENVYYHNGDKFNAQSVVDYVALVKEAVGTPTNVAFSSVETVTALSEYTVEFKLRGVNPTFLLDICAPSGAILNAKAIAEDDNKGAWIGTGPWKIVEFLPSDRVELARNEDYWGELPKTKTMTLYSIPEMSSRSIMLQTGEVDFAWNLPENDVPMFQNDPNFNIYTSYPSLPTTLSFNMSNPITGDKEFRLAVAHALDRETIRWAAVGEFGIEATNGSIWRFGDKYMNERIPIIPYDLAKAKQHLEASSYNGEVVEIAVALARNVKAAEALQEQLSKVGIKTTIKEMDSPSFNAYMSGTGEEVQLMIFTMSQNINPDSNRNFFTYGAAQNRSNYNNPEYIRLMDEAKASIDENKRISLYNQVQEVMAEDIPALQLFGHVLVFVAPKSLGGYDVSNLYYDFRWLYRVLDD